MTNNELPGASPEGGPSHDSLGAANSAGMRRNRTTARPGHFSHSPVTTRGYARNPAGVGGVLKPRSINWTPISGRCIFRLSACSPTSKGGTNENARTLTVLYQHHQHLILDRRRPLIIMANPLPATTLAGGLVCP